MHNSSHSSNLDVKYLQKNYCDMYFILSSYTHTHTIQTEISFEALNATWNCDQTYKLKSDNFVRYHSPFFNIVKRSGVETEREKKPDVSLKNTNKATLKRETKMSIIKLQKINVVLCAISMPIWTKCFLYYLAEIR